MVPCIHFFKCVDSMKLILSQLSKWEHQVSIHSSVRAATCPIVAMVLWGTVAGGNSTFGSYTHWEYGKILFKMAVSAEALRWPLPPYIFPWEDTIEKILSAQLWFTGISWHELGMLGIHSNCNILKEIAVVTEWVTCLHWVHVGLVFTLLD